MQTILTINSLLGGEEWVYTVAKESIHKEQYGHDFIYHLKFTEKEKCTYEVSFSSKESYNGENEIFRSWLRSILEECRNNSSKMSFGSTAPLFGSTPFGSQNAQTIFRTDPVIDKTVSFSRKPDVSTSNHIELFHPFSRYGSQNQSSSGTFGF